MVFTLVSLAEMEMNQRVIGVEFQDSAIAPSNGQVPGFGETIFIRIDVPSLRIFIIIGGIPCFISFQNRRQEDLDTSNDPE